MKLNPGPKRHIVKFQKMSMPTSRKVNANSKGEGGFKSSIFWNKSMKLKWNFWRGGWAQSRKPSMGGVWVFSGKKQCPYPHQ